MKRLILSFSLALVLIPSSLLACAILRGAYQLDGVQATTAEGCANFGASEKVIRNFFAGSADLSLKEKEKKYHESACMISGTIANGDLIAEFSIYASKIGFLKYPDGKVQWLACKKCGKPFF